MTLLKLLATAMVALTFLLIASPGFAANDGVTNGAPNDSTDPAAKPRRHHHKHQRDGQHHRRPRNQNPDQSPVGGSGQG